MIMIIAKKKIIIGMAITSLVLLGVIPQPATAFGVSSKTLPTLSTSPTSTRRGWFQDLVSKGTVGVLATAVLPLATSPSPVLAFDGSGSSAYAGRSPATKAELQKAYRSRVVADVKDFVALGKAISAGETEGPAWVNFFIQFQRREPDTVGRTYAALVDLRGLPTKKPNEYEGGDGLLLANTFTKAGKPPDNTPAVKSFIKLSRSFDAVEAAGKKGNVNKAKEEYDRAAALLSQYLNDVELPSDLSDPIYN